MRKLIQTVILLTLLTNCGEDEAEQKCRLMGQKYASIEYNDKGKIYAIQQLNDANEPVENGVRREFEYEGEKLIRIDELSGDHLSRYFIFEYPPNKIIQYEYFDEDPGVDYTLTYTLDDDGRIIQMIHESDNLPASYMQVYEYEGKNVVKVTATSTEPNLNSTLEFEFDNKRNTDGIAGFEIYFQDNIFSYRTQSANNTTKSILTRPGMEPLVNTYTYTYNSQGYAVEKFANGNTSPIWFYAFECH
jgi:hypothetical protein